MRSRIWRRCSSEGSMIWERCRREEPETGLGRSLFTPLPRHASVLDCACQRGQIACTYISTAQQLGTVSVSALRCIARLTEATRSPTRMPTSSDPADGSFLPSDSDPTGFIGGVLGGDLLANSRGEESSNERGDGRSGGGRGRERGRERGGGGKSARMCGRRGKSKGTTRCSISTPSSASEQPRNLFSNSYHLDNNRPRFKMHPSTPCWVSQRIHHPCIPPRAATCIHPAAKQRTKISHFPLVKLYMRHTTRLANRSAEKNTG